MQRHLSQVVAILWFAGAAGCVHVVPTTQLPNAPATNLVLSTPSPAKVAKPVNVAYVRQGYRAKLMGARYMYCREEVPTGSLLRSEVCKSEAQLLDEEADTRAILNNVSSRGTLCTLAGCRRR
jgi:hypothetical protein